MSIDLIIDLDSPISAEDLRRGTEDVVRTLVCNTPVPDVEIWVMSPLEHKQTPAGKQVIGQSNNSWVLAYRGQDDVVAVTAVGMDLNPPPPYCLEFSVGATRSPSEYVLALAGAIFAGRASNRIIDDGAQFWTGDLEHDPQTLLDRLALRSPCSNFQEACAAIFGKRSISKAD